MNVISIPLGMIDVGERLREIDEDYAQLLAEAFTCEGQRQPIEVRPARKPGGKHALISGGHRLRAASIAGLDTLFAVELKVSDLEARLREIDENLVRHELSPLDKAAFLVTRKKVWEQLHPEAAHGGDRKSSGQPGHLIAAERFSVVAADKFGFSERDIRRSVKRHNAIAPDVRRMISGTWLAWNGAQLDHFSRQTPERQRRVAHLLDGLPGVRDVGTILRHIDNLPAPPPADDFEKFIGLWRRAGAATRKRIRDHIAGDDRRGATP